MVVSKIFKSGFLDLRRIVTYDDFLDTEQQFKDAGKPIEHFDKEFFDKNKDMQILISPIKIGIRTESGIMSFDFSAGYMTDLASVPSALRSMVDNDQKEILLPALVHDANYGCHFYSFSDSNDIFRQMIRLSGGSWWLAFKAWSAVSLFGKSAYNKVHPSGDKYYEQRFIKMATGWRFNK